MTLKAVFRKIEMETRFLHFKFHGIDIAMETCRVCCKSQW